jgi:hypothetical protein
MANDHDKKKPKLEDGNAEEKTLSTTYVRDSDDPSETHDADDSVMSDVDEEDNTSSIVIGDLIDMECEDNEEDEE